MVACGAILFVRGYMLKRRRGKNPVLWLGVVAFVTAAYVAVSIATWFEIRPWTETVLTQKFTAPSGRILFPLSSAPGYGVGFSALAIAISILATILVSIEARGAFRFGQRKITTPR
jgi:hypothetical protein